MKLRKFITPLLSLLLMAGSALSSCTSKPTPPYTSITIEEFNKIIASPDVQLVDVRTPEEHAESCIPMSLNIDVKSEDFIKRAMLELNKECTIAVYCRSGRRSKIAAQKLNEAGFTVVELDAGFEGWKAALH